MPLPFLNGLLNIAKVKKLQFGLGYGRPNNFLVADGEFTFEMPHPGLHVRVNHDANWDATLNLVNEIIPISITSL